MTVDSTIQLLRRLSIHLDRRRKRQIAFLTFLSLLAAISELISLGSIIPFLAAITEPDKILDISFVKSFGALFGWSQPRELLVPLAILFSFAVTLSACVRLCSTWLGGRLAAAIGSDLSRKAYRLTLFQPYAIHVARNSSQVINSIIRESAASVNVINQALVTFTATLVSFSLVVGLLFINFGIAILSALLFLFFYTLVAMFVRKELTFNSRFMAQANIEAIKALQEGLGSIRDVLLDGSQMLFVDVYSDADVPARKLAARNAFLGSFPRYSLEAVGLVVIASIATFFALNQQSERSIIPLLGAFALGAQRLLPSLQQVYSGWTNVRSSNAQLSGFLGMLDQPEPPCTSLLYQKELFRLAVNFQDVHFSYSEDLSEVVKGISFNLKKGESLGLVGKTGSGKSTVIDLFMGLLIPTSGSILVDNISIHEDANSALLDSWKSQIAHVPQAIYLSDSSISENIAVGIPCKEIDNSRVRHAADLAQISEFIESLPLSYNTKVGERGVKLSGGQRQRIGIARALYRGAEILVLDEATSALDSNTEAEIMKSISRLKSHLTIVMVAHRLSTVSQCDRIIRLESGLIVQQGLPSEVLS